MLMNFSIKPTANQPDTLKKGKEEKQKQSSPHPLLAHEEEVKSEFINDGKKGKKIDISI